MTKEKVLIKAIENNIAVVTLNRPAKANSLNRSLFLEIRMMMEKLEQDDNVNVIVITGEGNKDFCAGVDLKERAQMSKSEAMADRGRFIKPCFEALRKVSKPIIAAVNGVALGGGAELALSCDIRIASENARFGQTEIKWGMMPAYGGCQQLRMIVGPGMAKELILSGKIIEADEACRIGIYNRVVPSETLMEEVGQLASEIANNSSVSVIQAKKAIDVGAGISESLDFEFEVSKACYFAGEAAIGPQKFKKT